MMKNKGFTLAEVLITLGIIGVVAALTAPTLTNLVPDKNKVSVLKMYSVIDSINTELLNDTSLYYPQYDGEDKINCKGFGCTGKILARADWMKSTDLLSNYEGEAKYRKLLKSKLEVDEYETVEEEGSLKFYLIDGTHWTITSDPKTGETFGEKIVINFKPSDTSACGTFSSTCKKPNKFSFHVDKYGKITAEDHLTQAYLDNSGKLNDKKADYAKALEALTAEEEALKEAQQ